MISNLPEVQFTAFVAGTVQDAKNSMGLLLERVEEVSDRYPHDPATQRNAIDVRYEVQRINAKLVALLTLYKLDQQRHAVGISPQSVCGLLDEALLTHRSSFETRGITVELECPDSLTGYIDFSLISGVINDALNNALRYARSRASVVAVAEDSGIAIYIEDDSAGFPQSLIQTAALPSSDRGLAFISSGLGLGLFFAEIITGMHRRGDRSGWVTVDNNGRWGGGRFGIHLP
jgi:two-component system sensor histidine kinase SenX3